MKSIRYWKPFVLANVSRSAPRSFAAGVVLFVRLRVWTTTGSAATSFGPDASAARAERRERGHAGAGERGKLLGGPVEARGDRADVAHQRRALIGEALQVRHRQADLAERLGQLLRSAPRGPRRARPSPRPRSGRWSRKPVIDVAVLGERREDACRRRSPADASWSFWSARILRTRSVWRRAGLARSMTAPRSSPRAGESGAELVEDDPEAVPVGRAVDVVDEVEVDGLAVVLDGAGSAGPRPARRRRSSRARAAPVIRGRAAGSGRSRRSARRSVTAAG